MTAITSSQQNKESLESSAPRAFQDHNPTPSQTNTSHDSRIAKFYSNKNVLITGATGFLGKVILWKLLDTCKDIGKIYVLIRSRNQDGAEKRLAHLLKGKPFNTDHQYVDLSEKVLAIESDITVPGLGLSPADRQLLKDQVNVVIHSAASVKFDAPLKESVRDNVYGTRSIVDLCCEIRKLEAYVHVSTAYSNCHRKDVAEDLVPLNVECDKALEIIEDLSEESCDALAPKLLEGRPNTYTYTKAMAEHFVGRKEGNFPIAIVRPSIVISAAQEPVPGWVDNVNGIAGLGSLAAIGVLRTIDWDYHAISDMVPVDYVANCIICAAREVSEDSPKKLLVYNMTSGNMNPISWGAFFEMLRNTATKTPPNKIVRPMIAPPKYRRANPITFILTRLFSELLFAYLVDMLLSLLGYKKIMLKITQKMHHGYRILRPFTSNQWNFSSKNVIKLSESLSPSDRDVFRFDMRNFSWLDEADRVWEGARGMILKEEPTEESYKSGRARQRLVTIIHYGFIGILLASLSVIGLKLLKSF